MAKAAIKLRFLTDNNVPDSVGDYLRRRGHSVWRVRGQMAPDAPDRAAPILAGLPQPFTAAEARKALQTSRRVVIPLLEWLDRKGITKRLADDRRTMREPPGSPRPNGGL